MRQVFSSARLENVEAVAKLLEEAGIETRVTNGRSYKSAIRGNFSYRDEGKQQPAVWIVRSEDQPRAREMLREAGLMDSSRNAPDSYIALSFRNELPDRGAKTAGERRAFRIKLGLIAVIAVVIALTLMSWRSHRTPGTVTALKPIALVSTAELPRGKVPVPDSLALAVLRGDVPTEAGSTVCIAVDGHDPSPALLAALPRTQSTLLPVSRCPAQANGDVLPLVLAVGRYESGVPSGAGIVYFVRRRGNGPVVPRWFEVRPEGDGWRVIQPL